METIKSEKQWERTNVTNLVRNHQSGKYYARVKVNGKQKWCTLKAEVFSVAKLRLADVEKTMRAQGAAARGQTIPGAVSETTVNQFIAAFSARVTNNSQLARSSKARTSDSVKALVKTGPELPNRDVRRVTN